MASARKCRSRPFVDDARRRTRNDRFRYNPSQILAPEVSQDEAKRGDWSRGWRMAARSAKLSDMDLKSYERWYDYSRARDAMFRQTDSALAPWLRHSGFDDRRRAPRISSEHILDSIPYEGYPARQAGSSRKRDKDRTTSEPELSIQDGPLEILMEAPERDPARGRDKKMNPAVAERETASCSQERNCSQSLIPRTTC